MRMLEIRKYIRRLPHKERKFTGSKRQLSIIPKSFSRIFQRDFCKGKACTSWLNCKTARPSYRENRQREGWQKSYSSCYLYMWLSIRCIRKHCNFNSLIRYRNTCNEDILK